MNVDIISLILMASIYNLAGINHFLNPKFYLKITPNWVPRPELANAFVGAIEIILGIGLLIPTTKQIAAIGIILLLIAVFPANIFHFQKSMQKKKHVILTLIRLPIQALLIYWAYTFI